MNRPWPDPREWGLNDGTLRDTMNQTRQNSIQSFAFVISVCIAAGFCRGFISNTGEGESTSSLQKIELDSRINPNDAPIESLVRLPGLGISRAGAIVEYRNSFNGKDGKSPAFQHPDDLQKITGIGPKTVQNLSEWIKFE